jgi:hypothetical protein
MIFHLLFYDRMAFLKTYDFGKYSFFDICEWLEERKEISTNFITDIQGFPCMQVENTDVYIYIPIKHGSITGYFQFKPRINEQYRYIKDDRYEQSKKLYQTLSRKFGMPGKKSPACTPENTKDWDKIQEFLKENAPKYWEHKNKEEKRPWEFWK